MHAGSCLCGNVKYEIRGELGAAFYCHCGRCRKASGSAFGSNVLVSADDFVIVQGQDSLKTFKADSGLSRSFCSNCGSPISSSRAGPPVVRVRMGSLDTPLTEEPQAHIFTGSKAGWSRIHDELPQHAERPPS